MRKPLLSLAVLCFAVSLAAAQSVPADSVCEVHTNKVKPGMTGQYEQGRIKHMAWHKAQNDSWSWNTFDIATGPDTGDYLISTCGHSWKDFDGREKFNTADAANANATMGASLASQTMAYYVLRKDVSDSEKPGPPPPYFSLLFFHIKPDAVMDFANGIKQVNEAFTKTNTPRFASYWYNLANGGSSPEMVLVQERKTMGDMAGSTPKTLDEVLKEAYGDQGAATMTTIRKSFYHYDSELLHYRQDLSYTAPGSK